jgi:hypothetical protein
MGITGSRTGWKYGKQNKTKQNNEQNKVLLRAAPKWWCIGHAF